MSDALIQIVDEHDKPVGAATKQEARERGLIHRVVRIMLEDAAGRILLQHRDPAKDIFPDCWDNSAAGHVDAGEDYEEAAHRELKEEIGIEGLQLTAIGTYYSEEVWKGMQLKRFNTVYKAAITKTPTALEAGKVDLVQWFTLPEVKALVAGHPDKVSDGLAQVITKFY